MQKILIRKSKFLASKEIDICRKREKKSERKKRENNCERECVSEKV